MKEHDPQIAAKVLSALSAGNPALSDGLAAKRLEEAWMVILGDPARRYTTSVSFHGGKLTVEVANDAWKNELMLSRTALRERLNSSLGYEAVGELRFL